MSTTQIEARPDVGRFELHRLGDLTVIPEIQRTPKPARVKALGRNGWDPTKEGILLVALITDGKHKGKLHTYDGGTRWVMGTGLEDIDGNGTKGVDYVMPCYVKDMTEAEAAEAFDNFNSLSKTPSAWDHYHVGIAYGQPAQMAIKRSLDTLGLIGSETAYYGNGRPGEVAALASCKTVVNNAYRKVLKDQELDEEGRWEAASDHLVEVLEILRDAYLDEDAHDSDMIKALSRVLMGHNKALTIRVRRHLVRTISSAAASQWRAAATDMMQSSGGSESRGNAIAGILATEHNRTAAKGATLRTPITRGAPVDLEEAEEDE